jgi:hypothetical protein
MERKIFLIRQHIDEDFGEIREKTDKLRETLRVLGHVGLVKVILLVALNDGTIIESEDDGTEM